MSRWQMNGCNAAFGGHSGTRHLPEQKKDTKPNEEHCTQCKITDGLNGIFPARRRQLEQRGQLRPVRPELEQFGFERELESSRALNLMILNDRRFIRPENKTTTGSCRAPKGAQ